MSLGEPDPPVNVRVERADGSVIPIDTVFVGYDPTGDAIWAAVNCPAWVSGSTYRVDVLPSHSAVSDLRAPSPGCEQ